MADKLSLSQKNAKSDQKCDDDQKEQASEQQITQNLMFDDAMPSDTTGMEYIFDFADFNDDAYTFSNPNGDNNDESKIQCIDHKQVQFEAELGVGANSKVFFARWKNKEVAAKRFTNMQQNCYNLVTEYMNYGCVKEYVCKKRPGSVDISILDRIEIALQAANGIKHLHSLEIIHSEIMCKNLMMEFVNGNVKNIRVVVTDYAQSEMLQIKLGPLKWMAPERIEGSDATLASDIYSFGITIWEILTGNDEPYHEITAMDAAIHVLVNEKRPEIYDFVPKEIKSLLQIMWHKSPNERSIADKVVKTLNKFVDAQHKIE